MICYIGQIPPMVFGVTYGFESFIPTRSTGSVITLTSETSGLAAPGNIAAGVSGIAPDGNNAIGNKATNRNMDSADDSVTGKSEEAMDDISIGKIDTTKDDIIPKRDALLTAPGRIEFFGESYDKNNDNGSIPGQFTSKKSSNKVTFLRAKGSSGTLVPSLAEKFKYVNNIQ